MSAPETLLDGRVALWLGDVRAMLAAMESDSVDCVVTSPPYWGLRDYGGAGTLTKTSGSGDATIAFTATMPGSHPDYYTKSRQAGGPLGGAHGGR